MYIQLQYIKRYQTRNWDPTDHPQWPLTPGLLSGFAPAPPWRYTEKCRHPGRYQWEMGISLGIIRTG